MKKPQRHFGARLRGDAAPCASEAPRRPLGTLEKSKATPLFA